MEQALGFFLRHQRGKYGVRPSFVRYILSINPFLAIVLFLLACTRSPVLIIFKLISHTGIPHYSRYVYSDRHHIKALAIGIKAADLVKGDLQFHPYCESFLPHSLSIPSKFPIPREFQLSLQFAACIDTRADTENLTSLTVYMPVTSERNIWAFRDTGVLSMPSWCRRNVCDWVRIHGPSSGWTIRILDNALALPNYALKFLPLDQVPLPKCFVEGTMGGPFKGQHKAGFVKRACLFMHGGMWSDVGQVL